MEEEPLQRVLGKGVEILRRDGSGLVALSKPAGIRSHPNGRTVDRQALLRLPYEGAEEAYHDGGKPVFWLLNRLDGPTSGVILIALQKPMAMAVKAAFERKAVLKEYVAVVKGKRKEKERVWRDRLATRKVRGSLRTVAGEGPLAVTRLLEARPGLGRFAVSRLRLQPETGRTHQLRVQCAVRGLPIVGDQTYGDFGLNRELAAGAGVRRLCLHASRVALEIKVGGELIPFEASAELPEVFRRLLGDNLPA